MVIMGLLGILKVLMMVLKVLMVADTLPTPWGTQMWVQIENNRRVKSQGTLPSS
jgi:hypothetical protein